MILWARPDFQRRRWLKNAMHFSDTGWKMFVGYSYRFSSVPRPALPAMLFSAGLRFEPETSAVWERRHNQLDHKPIMSGSEWWQDGMRSIPASRETAMFRYVFSSHNEARGMRKHSSQPRNALHFDCIAYAWRGVLARRKHEMFLSGP